MRYATDRSDPGYANYRRAMPCRVYLDGVEIKHCFMADEEAGEIHAGCQDAAGKLFLDPVLGKVKTQTLRGHVRVVAGDGSVAAKQPAWMPANKPGRTHPPMN